MNYILNFSLKVGKPEHKEYVLITLDPKLAGQHIEDVCNTK